MKIEYKDADGRVLELEVSDEVGRFCISSAEEEDMQNAGTAGRTAIRLWRHLHMRTVGFSLPRQTPCGKRWRTAR